ncbi:hypothetical protein Gorai_007663 [Gossypium raimondii]|uniref:Uncharacterized protein n=1 Tax=Gossypium raimondii TaxID=29730 RepID=A0A7J8Q8J7_GOSRA|nr:hypothetical protein [Gossypium raimondii]
MMKLQGLCVDQRLEPTSITIRMHLNLHPATFIAKQHKCYLASLQMTKQQSVKEPKREPSTPHIISNDGIVDRDSGTEVRLL